jgi:beta-lactam-binding protein with PASTA domain
MGYDDDDIRVLRRGRPVLAAFVTSLVTTIVAFIALTAADRRGMLGFLRPAARDVEVPSLAGATVEQAREVLQARHLLLTLQAERPDPTVPAGKIAGQVPLAGSRARAGTAIQAFVSSGAGAIAVPDVSGIKPDEAVDKLRELKLVPGHRREEPNASMGTGLVSRTDPPAGKLVSPDTTVAMIVSTGAPTRPVPKVLGFRFSKAKKTLEDAGFKVGTKRYGSSDNYDDEVIIKQDPAENTAALPGTPINLVINE